MNTPQIVMIVLMAMSVGLSWANHGRPRSNENVWTTLIAAGIQIGILKWGGFF